MEQKEKSVMTDTLIALLVMALVAVYYYGFRAAVVIIITVAAGLVTEFICVKLRKKAVDKSDISALVISLTAALMMSPSVPYYEAVLAAIVAIAIARQAFGGRGCEVFPPAAVGYLFTALCFPDGMLTYPKAVGGLSMSAVLPSETLGQSMTKTLMQTGTASVSLIDLLVGKYSGPMGTGVLLLLAVAAAYLMLRKSASAIAFFTEFAVTAVYALFRYDFDIMAVLYFFTGGMTLFGMIFLSCLATNVPQTKSSRFLYGLVTGLLIIMFSQYAAAENAVVYAVIIAAPVGIELDRRALSFAGMLKKRRGRLRKSNKTLGSINETIEMLDDKDKQK